MLSLSKHVKRWKNKYIRHIDSETNNSLGRVILAGHDKNISLVIVTEDTSLLDGRPKVLFCGLFAEREGEMIVVACNTILRSLAPVFCYLWMVS